MRAGLVWALVLGSLVFSVGGVAVVGRADGPAEPQAQAPTPVTPSDPQAPQLPRISTAAPKECKQPQRLEARTVPLKPTTDVVVKNTRGYNYLTPGDFRPSPTSEPPAAPAAPAVPAAPESK
jgi:hypothetical protein